MIYELCICALAFGLVLVVIGAVGCPDYAKDCCCTYCPEEVFETEEPDWSKCYPADCSCDYVRWLFG